MRVGATYTAGRLCAVVTKPLCLFAANNFLTADTALGLAVAFLASGLALVGIAAAPDRRFYARYFSAQVKVNGLTFYLYAVSVALLAVLGVLIVVGISAYYTRSWTVSIAAAVFFISEKLADEMFRLRLFERDFNVWGRSSVARSLLQLGGFGVVVVAFGHATPAWMIVLVLAAANFGVFVPQLPLELGRSMQIDRFGTMQWLGRRAVSSLSTNWILWAIALLGSSVGYLDRLVALVLDKTVLPLFMLVVMCFSIVQMVVDFYYVSRHRRDFLERSVSVGAALASREFLGSLGLGLLGSAAACAIVLAVSRSGAAFPLGYILIIATLQASMAIAAIPREILYWSRFLSRILHIELSFWTLFLFAAFASWALGLPTMVVFGTVAVCAVIRLVLYVVIGGRTDEYSYALSEQGNR